MGIQTVNVWHRLNASEGDGRAVFPLNVVDAQRNVPPQILSAVDELLENIAPSGETTAYAVKRFGSPGEIGSYVCLVASHLYVDGWKRRTALNHARILRVEDDHRPWLDLNELVELAVGFESDNALVRSPEGIRDRVLDVETNVGVAEWSEHRFEEVERGLAQTVIEICVSRVSSPESIAVPLPPQSSSLAALRAVAAAWASLPMAIQRASAFSIDAKKGTRVKILFTTAAGSERQPTVTQQTRDFAASYIRWLHDCPDDVRALIMNPDISDGPTLLRAFEARAPLPIPREDARALNMNAGISEATTLVSELDRGRAPQPTHREERTMAKNKRPAEGPRRELDLAVTRYINEQVSAAEESIRESMKKWTGAVQQGMDRGGSAPRDPSGVPPPPSRFPRRWSEIAAAAGAGVVGGVLAASLTVLMMRPHASTPPSTTDRVDTAAATQTFATTTRQDAAQAVQPQPRTPFESLTGTTWAEKFQTLSNNDPKRLASVVDAIAANFVNDPKTRFEKLRTQIESGKTLADVDRKFMRTVLFQMLAQNIGGSDFRIDGKFESVPADAVRSVMGDLNLESTKTSTDGDIANVEAEAILRWAARRGL
jgi:hypothetical protein